MTATTVRVGDKVTWSEFLFLPVGTVGRTILSAEHPSLVFVVHQKGSALATGIRGRVPVDNPYSYHVRILEIGASANMGIDTNMKGNRDE